MPPSRWYYLLGGEVERGPVTTEALTQLMRSGRVHLDTPVRRETKEDRSASRWSFVRARGRRSSSSSSKKASKGKRASSKRWAPYYRTIPNDGNRFDAGGLFDDLPPLPLEEQALRSLLASLARASSPRR